MIAFDFLLLIVFFLLQTTEKLDQYLLKEIFIKGTYVICIEIWRRLASSKKMAKEIYSVNTVANTLCRRKSTHYMKIPLKSTEQIYLIFLIPTLINCFVYIIHFAADLVVAIQHFKEQNPLWGICTIAIIYLPALMYFILTVSRPDWWMTEDDKISKGIVGWFALQMCQFIGFVFFVLYRYCLFSVICFN